MTSGITGPVPAMPSGAHVAAPDCGEHDAVVDGGHHLHLVGRPTVGDDVDIDVDRLPRRGRADELHARGAQAG